MGDLIKALQIFLKYGNPKFPTHCEHDVMYIHNSIDPKWVTEEDKLELETLGFFVSDDDGELGFKSYRFGSC